MWVVRNDYPPSSKLKHMNQKHELDFSIPLIAIIIFIAVLASSCSRNGYGCQGRSKIITRVK